MLESRLRLLIWFSPLTTSKHVKNSFTLDRILNFSDSVSLGWRGQGILSFKHWNTFLIAAAAFATGSSFSGSQNSIITYSADITVGCENNIPPQIIFRRLKLFFIIHKSSSDLRILDEQMISWQCLTTSWKVSSSSFW